MNRNHRSLERLLAGAAFGALTLGGQVMAADIPLKAPYLRPAFDWSGFYIGAHTGYGRGASSGVFVDPALTASSSVVSGLLGGVQAGYNFQSSSGIVLGVEADLTFPNYLPTNHVVSKFVTPRSSAEERWDYFGTVRGRVGYASGPWLAYATGGFAWTGERFLNTPAGADVEEKHINIRPGWAAGAGLEYAFAPHWSVRLEYLYAQFGKADVRFPSGTQVSSTFDFQSLRLGLNRKIDWPGSKSWTPKADLTDPESDRWEIHGQTTYLGQGYPAFRAPYTGTNSLTPARQYQATWSNSLYLNARLWEGGEVYYNPELRRVLGLAIPSVSPGFPAARRRSRTSPTRTTTPRGCMYARLSDSAGSRKNSPAASSSWPARSTSTG